MRAWMLGGISLFAANLTGCVIYNSDGNDPWDNDDGDWWSDDDGTDTADTDPLPVEDPTESFSITPSEVEVGDTTLVTITSSAGFDFSAVADVSIDGPVEVHDVLVRPDEVNVVLTVSSTAALGTTAAVWVVLDDGTAWLLDATLKVVVADDNPCD